VSTFTNPTERKKKVFAREQERVRKDIECAFGILVQRFHVLQRPLRGWYLEELDSLLKCCVILHNMTVDHRYGSVDDGNNIEVPPGSTFPLFGQPMVTHTEAVADVVDLFSARVAQFGNAMESSYEHFLLKKDLVEHINSLNN
jgi:Plant transposon protein